MPSSEPIVVTKDLTRTYSDGHVRALDGVNLTIHTGELVAVMGPSGSGKSTLLNMIGALDKPTSGEVYVQGQNLATLKNVDQFRAKTVGFIFQLHNLLPALTARENVEIPMHGQPFSEKERRERAAHLLEMVGLGDRMHHLPSQLSGGQRQRVAVARALANNPSILLADEPTGSLDTRSGDEILALLEKIYQEYNHTILIVTHDPRVARRTQRILSMLDGKIVDDHRVRNTLTEDLRELAHSELGEILRRVPSPEALAALEEVGLAKEGQLTPTAHQLLNLIRQFEKK